MYDIVTVLDFAIIVWHLFSWSFACFGCLLFTIGFALLVGRNMLLGVSIVFTYGDPH